MKAYDSELASSWHDPNLTPAELDEHLIEHAINDTEHEKLLHRDDQQMDLFQEAA
ncbi:hypothetical protein [Ralstonia pickettii]|uniref:hypothetical protein n=1 Tax=Ralstonia pickettii TaxID=329 RepID=UPI002D7902F8|nr:hypothetical protein [Ralstonia pickettii]